jgi:sec-independent protein translocase protein TatA
MWRPGIAEIIIVLVIVILLFGPGRISKIARELGSSITAFKEGLADGDKSAEKSAEKPAEEKQSDDKDKEEK